MREALPRPFDHQLLRQMEHREVEEDWKVTESFLAEPRAAFSSKCAGIASEITAAPVLRLCPSAQLVVLAPTRPSLKGKA